MAANKKQVPNRLVHEKSPYLLQHAYNPVNWYPWSYEAFEKAKSEDKPIFLSIGYSTCHWCHVHKINICPTCYTPTYFKSRSLSAPPMSQLYPGGDNQCDALNMARVDEIDLCELFLTVSVHGNMSIGCTFRS